MEVRFSPRAVLFFKRLNYTPWHALAEFVDNSTQSYFDNKPQLDALTPGDVKLEVKIGYESGRGGRLVISDNAMGMSEAEVARALTIGEPPPEHGYRSQFGLGLKTAATWFGDLWQVTTKRLGAPSGLKFVFDVDKVAAGLDVELVQFSAPEADHYTIVEIAQLNRRLITRTRERIANHLRTMYRNDLSAGWLRLIWNDEVLEAEGLPQFAVDPDGAALYKDFAFTLEGKTISGWAGVLEDGSRRRAGFSILHSDRVIRSAPDAWKPATIYGEGGGRNDLINQRLVGEIQLNEFPVSHSKDDIVWTDDQEQAVEVGLEQEIRDLVAAARNLRKTRPEQISPSAAKLSALELQRALAPGALTQQWFGRDTAISPKRDAGELVRRVAQRPPDFAVSIDGVEVAGYLDSSLEATDSYLTSLTEGDRLTIVVNLRHPYAAGTTADGLVIHNQHSAFDSLATWRVARSRRQDGAHADLKDALLRIAAATRNRST
jgi:hypothetical protein